VGRKDKAAVNGPLDVVADPPDPLFLKDPQDFGLMVRRHVADLIEEDRALTCSLDQAGRVSLRSCKGSPPIPEKLAFQQVLRDGRAVYGDEGCAGMGPQPVKGLGNQFLARPCFSADEDTYRQAR
jgi:hypothetical protein